MPGDPYMSENILVVEYEPRYTDRVKHALAGQPFAPSFAKDGEEALRALDGPKPQLIVLSSVVPKVSTAELIRAIRGRDALQQTPILLTVSGYNGKSPKQDAVRLGASDILPKPYSETEFLGKVQQMLGLSITAPAAMAAGTLTSNEIFGDLLDERSSAPSGTRRPMKPTDDVDKLLADTLGGVMPQKKKEPAAPPPTAPKPKSDFDKALQDTLSGLEKNARKTSAGTTPLPQAPPAPKPAPVVPPPPPPPPVSPFSTEKIALSSPVLAPTPVPVPAPMEDEEPADGVRFGQYVLLEKIATGGMAEVWKARMRGVEGFQKIVAIKKILPHLSDNQDFIEMFVDEAKLAAQLNHNNIIHIYDLGKIQNSYYIAMEYIDGSDLKAILKRAQERDHPMSVELALFIASKVAAALDYAHRKHDFEGKEMGLVHRDVSPQNVLISEEGDIKLCDFGIAKAASKASHTQAGALKGKLQYMSPEQAWGRQIDKRSDIFALATVLFEMLTARKLFGGDNELSILEQVREARVTAPSLINDEITPQIDQIVLKALQKEPSNRYQTAGEMQRDIDAVLYTFKPTPTSADLAIYMHRLASSEPVPMRVESPLIHEPEPELVPANELRPIAVPPPRPAAPVAPVAQAVPMPAWESQHPAPAAAAAAGATKKSPVIAIIIGLVVVIAAAGGYFVFRGKSAAPTTTTAPLTASAARSPIVPAPTSTIAPVTGTAALTTTAPAIDPSKVNEEVQKRLAAERTRLDQLRQQQTTTQAPVLGRTTPPPQPQPAAVATQTVAPAPQPIIPAPQPVVPAPQPVVPAPQPAAQPEPQVQRAQLGDLVPAGTEGLTPAHLTRQAQATYPPIARMQHIQGAVIVNALINENGQVVDTRILTSGSSMLNEAAINSVKRSSFTPGSKDGVRVKSWTPVRVDFKL
jgi:TonB family protein